MNPENYLVVCITSLLLNACGGSGSSSSPSPTPVFSLAISDAPVEDLLEVVVCFSEIELKANDANNSRTFLVGDGQGTAPSNELCTDDQDQVLVNTRGVNLLALAGMTSQALVTDIEIPAGEYTQIRLTMDDSSYAIKDVNKDGVGDDGDLDGLADKYPIRVPSNELKLDGFTATLGQNTAVTIEFDLRKSMTDPVGQAGYILKPRGVRLVDNSISGHIQGTVAEAVLVNHLCNVAPADLSEAAAHVYLYSGTNLDSSQFADNGGSESIESLTSAAVLFDGVDTYRYEIGFVNQGEYSLALSCDNDEDPEGEDEVNFIKTVETSVSDQGQISEANFVE